jgi:hypothetical protein
MNSRKRKPVAVIMGATRYRAFNLHAQFTPEGPDIKDESAFLEFCFSVEQRVTELKDKDLKREKAQFAKLKAAGHRVQPVMLKLLGNQISSEAAAEKFKRLVPDKKVARELLKFWDKIVTVTPEQAEKQKQDIARQEEAIAHSGRLLNARKAVAKGLTVLAEATEKGDPDAAKNLAEVAIDASVFLGIAEKRHPKLFKPVARMKRMWPILAKAEPG